MQLCWIEFVSTGSTPTPPIYYPPRQPSHPIAPGGGPSHPIYPTWPVDPGYGVPAPPLGTWGGVAPPYPSTGPVPPVGVWPGPGYPAHPIAPGGPPPGVWPAPGVPTHPIYYPPGIGVMPPIAYPPGTHPMPPIHLPSVPPPEPPVHVENPISGGWTLQFVPGIGWVVIPPPTGVEKPPEVGGQPPAAQPKNPQSPKSF